MLLTGTGVFITSLLGKDMAANVTPASLLILLCSSILALVEDFIDYWPVRQPPPHCLHLQPRSM